MAADLSSDNVTISSRLLFVQFSLENTTISNSLLAPVRSLHL